MGNSKELESLATQESRKRRRELFMVVPLALFVLSITWVEFKLFGMSKSLPLLHSIFFFGLVNFNIIIFLLLAFLIFRNVVKVFSEHQKGVLGGTLKAKLIAAFVAFSFIPTGLMFTVSVFYINNSFDKWFSEKVAGVLKSSLEVTNAYYSTAKKKNYHFAEQVADSLAGDPRPTELVLHELREKYSLDALEYYPGLFDDRLVFVETDENVPMVPEISMELLKKGVNQGLESSSIHHFAEGNLIRVIVPVNRNGASGAVVVSSFVPLSLISRMDDIASAFEEFRDVNPLQYPLKSIYLIILILMTAVILLGATWFGFYLARQLSDPLEELGAATKRVAAGDFTLVKRVSGSSEVNELIRNFNRMTTALEKSESEVLEANKNLKATLGQLDEHSRYIEVVLSNVTTGVISVDSEGLITMINQHASKLLQLKATDYVGKPAKDVMTTEQYSIFSELLQTMKQHRASSIQKEIRLEVAGKSVPLQINLSILYDEEHRELGKVLVFDDLTPVISAQRAAAWREVARRIAHEIKNPLTPIKLSAQRLKRKFGSSISDPAFEESTTMIIQQVDDLKGLVNEFSQFARLPKVSPVLGDFHRMIEDAMSLYRSAHKHIQFSLRLDSSLPAFRFDPDQMKRVINNLVDNAVAATRNVSQPKVEIVTHYDESLKVVRVVVSDNGSGIPNYMRDRIFEPYMTTKEHGTGLGLAIAKRTVEDHNGFIRALANNSQGIRIVIELPVIEAEVRNSSPDFKTEPGRLV